ncbi:MAG: response regulator transcription factor [Bacteroidales bacterium]|nr:response regulator transcription factor [Bacteroidales bacterium]
MKEIRCIIVEDEIPAQKILEKYVLDVPFLKLTGKYGDAVEASVSINTGQADLIFLDINMPKLSGIAFLKTMKNPPMVIFTTAYREYAHEGFELDAVDYLHKPYSFERFLSAVNKAFRRFRTMEPAGEKILNSKCSQTRPDFLFVKEDATTYKLSLSDILFIESIGDYIKIHTPDKVYITYQTLKKMEENLPPDIFVRVHKSYIISFQKIESIQGNIIKMEKNEVPIGYSYRKAFFERVKDHLS